MAIVEIHGRLMNHDEIVKIMKRAPDIYGRYLRRWLNREGKYFIGTKNKSTRIKASTGRKTRFTAGHDGLIRGQLVNKKTSRGKLWESRIIRTLRYRIKDKRQLNMQLEAGLLYNSRKQVHEIMEMMESGGTITSRNYMTVPVYQNLIKIHTFNRNAKANWIFHDKVRRKQFNVIFKNGKIYYIDKRTGLMLFVGKKTVIVKKQFEFHSVWNSIQSDILDEAEKVFDRATSAVEKSKGKK